MNENAKNALAQWRLDNPDGVGIRKNPIQKLVDNPKSKSQAIRSKCWECCGADSTALAEVKKCTSYSCPLFPFRPGAKEGDFELFTAAVAKYTVEDPQEEAGD